MDLGLQQMFRRTLCLRAVNSRFFPLPHSFLSGQPSLGKVFPGNHCRIDHRVRVISDGDLSPRVSSARLLTEVVLDPYQDPLIRSSPLEEINPRKGTAVDHPDHLLYR